MNNSTPDDLPVFQDEPYAPDGWRPREFDDNEFPEIYEDDEDSICPQCNGTGIYIDDIEPCDYCDGLGYKWWL